MQRIMRRGRGEGKSQQVVSARVGFCCALSLLLDEADFTIHREHLTVVA
jgi:hypothetical protein